MLPSKRAIDRSDHLLEEIKTDDKAATNATNGMENGETSLCGPQLARSNDAPELISLPLSSFLPWPIMLSSLSLKPQNKMSPSGMAAWQGPPALRLIPRRGERKIIKKDREGSVVRSVAMTEKSDL